MGWLTWREALAWAVVLVVAATVAWMVLPPRQTDEVALPAADATPEEVVTAYLDALEAHDCETAGALTSFDRAFDPTSWCRNVRDISDRTIGDTSRERPAWSGQAARDQVARVPATFVLKWRPFRGDVSAPSGRFHWGYLLVRGSADEPWRIYDQGAA